MTKNKLKDMFNIIINKIPHKCCNKVFSYHNTTLNPLTETQTREIAIIKQCLKCLEYINKNQF